MAGLKNIENRRWITTHRGPLWVHAGKATDHTDQATSARQELPDGHLPAGAILGWVTVVDVVPDHPSRWAEHGYYHWVLSDPVALPEPVPWRGAQGLWNFPARP